MDWVYPRNARWTQSTIALAGIAPDWRANSLPPDNRTIVGIERMAKRAAIACSASVSSLPRRTKGSNFAAAALNAGAICLQGPHHAAQKSTSSGIPLLLRCASKLVAPSVTGWASKRAPPQRPHLPPAVSLSRGTRFAVEQVGQMIRTGSDLFMSRSLGGQDAICKSRRKARTMHG